MRRVLFLIAAVSLVTAGCAGTAGRDFYGMPVPGVVEGALTYEDGRPVQGAEVYFYTDPDKKFRGPADYMSEPTGEDGAYMTELPAGRYWAVARKRASGSISGNLQKGDYYTREACGPLDVSEGARLRADLVMTELTGNMLFNVFVGKSGGQGVKGVVRGRDGAPVQHAYAFAYKDPKMAGKPDYVSEWTREDGAYVIHVMEPGMYYVGARTGYMGVPRPDEPYGRFDGSRDHSVTVKDGEFTGGVDVTLTRFSESR